MHKDIIDIKTSDIPDYNADHDYFAFAIKGDCLNHDDCPIRIKDGDMLLAQHIERREFIRNWHAYQNEIVMVEPYVPNSLNINHALVKQLVAVENGWFVVMRMFNPDMTIELPIDEIKEISIVKKVIEP